MFLSLGCVLITFRGARLNVLLIRSGCVLITFRGARLNLLLIRSDCVLITDIADCKFHTQKKIDALCSGWNILLVVLWQCVLQRMISGASMPVTGMTRQAKDSHGNPKLVGDMENLQGIQVDRWRSAHSKGEHICFLGDDFHSGRWI